MYTLQPSGTQWSGRYARLALQVDGTNSCSVMYARIERQGTSERGLDTVEIIGFRTRFTDHGVNSVRRHLLDICRWSLVSRFERALHAASILSSRRHRAAACDHCPYSLAATILNCTNITRP